MGVDRRAIEAANNNAGLYAAMFSTQGLAYERLPYAFIGKDRPPPYYSNLTVLSPGHTDEVALQLQALAHQFNGAVGIKDSFCELDFRAIEFDTLFHASWIWKDAGHVARSSAWRRIEDDADLRLWEEAWKKSGSPTRHRMFPDEMMTLPEIVFLGYKTGGEYEAGCIATISDTCIGVSNVFSTTPSGVVFAQAAAAVASVAPRLPIVGYESGRDLDQACKAGFTPVGDLRILVAAAARF